MHLVTEQVLFSSDTSPTSLTDKFVQHLQPTHAHQDEQVVRQGRIMGQLPKVFRLPNNMLRCLYYKSCYLLHSGYSHAIASGISFNGSIIKDVN